MDCDAADQEEAGGPKKVMANTVHGVTLSTRDKDKTIVDCLQKIHDGVTKVERKDR